MKSRLVLVLFSLSFLFACGGGSKNNSTSTSGNVSVTPGTASVPINTTQQFTATVANSTQGVYWSVNDVVGGDLTHGTISTSGLYSAPAVIPSPATVTIKATSIADSSQVSSATVTITTGTALTIGLTPSTASVYTGRTQQFTATFNTGTNTGVTWQVNSITGGDSTHGTIATSGSSGTNTYANYTAPATVPSPATVTITAISQADTSKTATATVTIVAGTVISITPGTASVPAGGTQTFTATANSQPYSATWTVNCGSTQAGACGTISTGATSSATYTAPAYPPLGGGVSITATPTDNSALPAGATATIQVSNGSLSGQYAFAVSGTSGGTAYVAGGTVKFDGAGNVTGGTEDMNNGTASIVAITGGTYHVGTDGRGNAAIVTASGTQNWQFALEDNTKAYVMRADATATGSGVLYLQDSTKFAIATVTGKYGLELAPPASQTGTAAYAGVVTADGAGTISGGLVDRSAGTTVSTAMSVSGSYTAPDATSGRGTMTLTTSNGTQTLAYYVVDGTRALAVDLDGSAVVRGELVQQSGTISVASLVGSYAMVASGWNSQGKLALGGVFALDGTGGVSAGTADINANGNVQSAVTATGTYTVTDTTTGRTELSLTIGGQARKFAVYPQALGVADVLEIDGVQTTSGRAYLQAANATSASTFQGTYAASLAGADFLNPGEIDVTGVVAPNGGSALSGALDVNDAGTIARGASFQGTYLTATNASRKAGSFTTSAAVLNSGQLVYYVVNSNRALVLELDSNRVATGAMEKPY